MEAESPRPNTTYLHTIGGKVNLFVQNAQKCVSEILRLMMILTLDDLDRLAEGSDVLGRRSSFAARHGAVVGTAALGAREFLLWWRSVRWILHTSILTSIVSCRIQTRRGFVGATQRAL